MLLVQAANVPTCRCLGHWRLSVNRNSVEASTARNAANDEQKKEKNSSEKFRFCN